MILLNRYISPYKCCIPYEVHLYSTMSILDKKMSLYSYTTFNERYIALYVASKRIIISTTLYEAQCIYGRWGCVKKYIDDKGAVQISDETEILSHGSALHNAIARFKRRRKIDGHYTPVVYLLGLIVIPITAIAVIGSVARRFI